MGSNTEQNRKAFREAQSRALTTITIEPRRPGRPSTYTPERGALVCSRMIEAGTLVRACRDYDDMPDRHTVNEWCRSYPEFDAMFSRARERLMDRWADDIVEIADDTTLDPNERRIMVDTRWRLMQTLGVRRFGNKVQVGGDPDNPIEVLHKSIDVKTLTDTQLELLGEFTASIANAKDVDG